MRTVATWDVYGAVCVHKDGTEHPAPTEVVRDAPQQRWVPMSVSCRGTSKGEPE